MTGISTKGRFYEAQGTLCASFELKAKFPLFHDWLVDYTATAWNSPQRGETYSMRLRPAEEWSATIKKLLEMSAAGKEALKNPEVAEMYKPNKAIYEFFMQGWRFDDKADYKKGERGMDLLPIDAVYIKCILLDDARMEVSVYYQDATVADYVTGLANAMKARWGWARIGEAYPESGLAAMQVSEGSRHKGSRPQKEPVAHVLAPSLDPTHPLGRRNSFIRQLHERGLTYSQVVTVVTKEFPDCRIDYESVKHIVRTKRWPQVSGSDVS